MYIMSQTRKFIIDCRDAGLDERLTNYVIGTSSTGASVSLGKYETENEAIFVLGEIYDHIQKDSTKPYKMPQNAIGRKYPFVNDPNLYSAKIAKEVEIL